jgi:hypothetical protein
MCSRLGVGRMRRGRLTSGLVLGAFGAALTVLPWLHTLHHRDDHVHVDGAIVFLEGHDHEHGGAHDHGHGDGHDDDDDTPYAGFDHPSHHGPHGRGALAHGSAFIVSCAFFVLPPPAVALERPSPPAAPAEPVLAPKHSPRVTRGPPRAA